MFSAATNFFRRRPVTGADPAISDSSSTYEVPLYTNAAYYPNWRIYRKQPPSSLRLGFISHVFYAFAWYVINQSLSMRRRDKRYANLDLVPLQGERRWHGLCMSYHQRKLPGLQLCSALIWFYANEKAEIAER